LSLTSELLPAARLPTHRPSLRFRRRTQCPSRSNGPAGLHVPATELGGERAQAHRSALHDRDELWLLFVANFNLGFLWGGDAQVPYTFLRRLFGAHHPAAKRGLSAQPAAATPDCRPSCDPRLGLRQATKESAVPQDERHRADGVFEGGGVKGIAFAGAIAAAERDAGVHEWVNVAGTSAGSIVAALLSTEEPALQKHQPSRAAPGAAPREQTRHICSRLTDGSKPNPLAQALL
jgi:Patatin-like phospholipase